MLWESGCLAVEVASAAMETMFSLGQAAGGHETGGILVGHYIDNGYGARVDEALPPPPDSRSGPTWFYRGVRGLRTELQHAWRERGTYYLGEWHTHPKASPQPSGRDRRELAEISRSIRYSCPEPILVLVGDRMEVASHCGVYVFRWAGDPIGLHPRSKG